MERFRKIVSDLTLDWKKIENSSNGGVSGGVQRRKRKPSVANDAFGVDEALRVPAALILR